MAPTPRFSRLWLATGPVLVVLIGLVVLVASMRVPYVALSPGSARAVEPLVEVSARPGGPDIVEDAADADDLLFVTVSTLVEPSGIALLLGWMDDLTEIQPSAPFLGTQSGEENRRLNLELMTDSQDKARKVALERLGFEVETDEQGAFLEDVDPTLPAGAVLRPGMTVVGAGGEPVGNRTDLVAEIEARSPGDSLELEVIPLGEREPQTVTAVLAARPDDPEVPVLGITVADRVSYRFPVDVQIDSGKVGGPSAGLAFTLAILDRLSEGSLTGDNRVAVTGTMELDGTVGPVGGVHHKAEAAIREGATMFLVPMREFERANEAADGRLQVVGVADLDDALEALESLGGTALPGVS